MCWPNIHVSFAKVVITQVAW